MIPTRKSPKTPSRVEQKRNALISRIIAPTAEGFRLARGLASAPGVPRNLVTAAAARLAAEAAKPKRKVSHREILRDEAGAPLEIRGVAIRYGFPSIPLEVERFGFREVIAFGAADKVDLRNVYLTRSHDHAAPIVGDLDLAVVGFGLVFRLSRILGTPANRDLVAAIHAGRAPGCSFTAKRLLGYLCQLGDEVAFEVPEIGGLQEIGISVDRGPAYPDTAVWLGPTVKQRPQTVVCRTLWDIEVPTAKWVRAIPPRLRRAAA